MKMISINKTLNFRKVSIETRFYGITSDNADFWVDGNAIEFIVQD